MEVVINRAAPVTYPVTVDNNLSVIYELPAREFAPAETISINFDYEVNIMNPCTSKVSDEFLVDAMFSLNRCNITITNNTERKATLEGFKVYGRKYYTKAVE